MTNTPSKTRQRPVKGRQRDIKRVVIYLRQSLDARDDRAAVRRQLTTCERWIAAHYPDARVVQVYEDNDTSASKRGVVRKDFQRMLADGRAGEFDLLVAYHLDRLTRTIRDLLPLLELATEHGVGTTTVSGELDLTSDMGRLVAGILAVVAQAEVDRKGARQVLGNETRAEEGRPHQGGRRPFGYRIGFDDPVKQTGKHMVKDPAEARLVKRMFDSFVAGASLRSIAAELSANGTTTVLGKPWTHVTVRQVLRNPRYAGIYTRHGEEYPGVKAAWPRIVKESTYRTARTKLDDPSRRTNHTGGEKRRLLTGVALCGVCGDGATTVLGGSRGAGKTLYQCRKTPKHLQRLAAPIEEYVEALVLDRLRRPDATDLLIDHDAPDVDALIGERVELVERQQQAADQFADSAITAAQLRRITKRLTDRIEVIDKSMSNGNRERVLGELVRARDPQPVWQALSLERKQAVLRELGTWTIDRGKVGGNPATRYRTAQDYRVQFTPNQ